HWRALTSDEITADSDGHKVKGEYDADSMAFVTAVVRDFRMFNSVEGIKFSPTHANRAPRNIRIAMPTSSRRNFTPCYADGSEPKKGSNTPTIDEFPGLNIAKVMFKGALTAHMSLHIISNGNVIGTSCPTALPRTWNFAFCEAIRNYRTTETFEAVEWGEESRKWQNGLAGKLYAFRLDGNNDVNVDASVYGKVSIFLLEMIFDVIKLIADGTWTASLIPEGVTSQAAKMIVHNSCLVVQAAGFKDCWPGMVATLDAATRRSMSLPPAPHLAMDRASWETYNKYLQNCFQITYKRARAFFFKKNVEDNFSDSAFCAIDIAVVFTCADLRYNLIPSGVAAGEIVRSAAKARKQNITMPAEDSDNEGEDVLDHSAEEEENGNNGRIPNTTLERDSESEDGNESESEPDPLFDQEIGANDEGDGNNERLPTASFDTTAEENGNLNGSSDDELLVESVVFDWLRAHGFRKWIRTRFPLHGTTGRIWSNFQQRPGVRLEVMITDDGRLIVLAYLSDRACPIVQIYEPSTRAGLQDKTEKDLRRQARQIPQMIARFVSEVEGIIAAAHSATKKKTNGRDLNMFELIRESFRVLDSWLERLKVHTMQTRYELTFATALANSDENEKISVPIADGETPVSCLSFVRRRDLYEGLKLHVDHHRYILVQGLCAMEKNPQLKELLPNPVWAAYMAAAEVLVLLLGAGAGSKWSILERSIQRAKSNEESAPNTPFHYDNNWWDVHPDFIQVVSTDEEWSTWACVTEGVDPSTCNIQMMDRRLRALRAVDDDDEGEEEPDEFLDWLQEKLPVHQIEGLKGLRNPTQYRKCVQMMYMEFIYAGDPTSTTANSMFQAVNWAAVGATPRAVVKLYERCANVIVALYRVELAERITAFWNSTHKRSLRGGFNMNDATKAIYRAKTKLQIIDCVLVHLDATWPSPIIFCPKPIGDAAEIYTYLTGYPSGSAFPTSVPTGQGWVSLGVPRALIALGRMCGMVKEVAEDVIRAFGGRNPFRDVSVFQHFLASELAKHGSLEDPAFIFKSRKSELRMEQSNCLLIAYNSSSEFTALTRPFVKKPETNPDDIQRDSFAGNFLTISHTRHFNLLNNLSRQLAEEHRGPFDQMYLTNGSPTHNSCWSCPHILLLQAYIIFFYRNQGMAYSHSQMIMPTDYSNVIGAIYTSPSKIKYVTKEIMKPGLFKSSLQLYQEPDTFEKLEVFAKTKWEVHGDLIRVAVKSLKSPKELMKVDTHQDALLASRPKSDTLSFHLKAIQVQMSDTRKADANRLSVATFIVSKFGIVSEEFLGLLESIRNDLRYHIDRYHKDPSPCNLDSCSEVVKRYGANKSHTYFKFDPAGCKPPPDHGGPRPIRTGHYREPIISTPEKRSLPSIQSQHDGVLGRDLGFHNTSLFHTPTNLKIPAVEIGNSNERPITYSDDKNEDHLGFHNKSLFHTPTNLRIQVVEIGNSNEQPITYLDDTNEDHPTQDGLNTSLDGYNQRQLPQGTKHPTATGFRESLSCHPGSMMVHRILSVPLSPDDLAIIKDKMESTDDPELKFKWLGLEGMDLASFWTLKPRIWLRGQVVDYYMKLLQIRNDTDYAGSGFCFLDSNFYTRLMNNGIRARRSPTYNRYNYELVESWVSGRFDAGVIFNHTKIIIPINQDDSHWICAVISLKEKNIQVYDSIRGKRAGPQIIQNLMRYLDDEHSSLHVTGLPNKEAWQSICTNADTPQQQNGYDCGVFTCLFADCVSLGVPMAFDQSDIDNNARQKLALAILNDRPILQPRAAQQQQPILSDQAISIPFVSPS
ncbi:unnamed protein product, partial [Cylindrotheca closterium]